MPDQHARSAPTPLDHAITPDVDPDIALQVAHEQAQVDLLYRRLDEMRSVTTDLRTQALLDSDGTPGGLTERDIATARQSERIAAYNAAEYGLCFGRLDFSTATEAAGEHAAPLYIGRIGIFDEEYQPLLVDWRAPSARPFYLATAAAPLGVSRRRHLRTSKRRVIGLDDEVLDLTASALNSRVELTGEAGLLAALTANRTGRMSDIVDTIQAEQDRIIRADQHGVLVVQGGPGTGKTAVALHRAAYLMYTHRERLANRGVLVVGPNPAFLTYIEHVLPSLGETAVALATVGTLYPGVVTHRADTAAAARVKGAAVMAEVMATAVRDRQTLPEEPHTIEFEREEVFLDRATCLAARRRARSSRRPHNLARAVFARQVIAALAQQYGDLVGANVLGGPSLMNDDDLADVRTEMAADPVVDALIDEYWPMLTPEALLGDLLGDADRIDDATTPAGLDDADRVALLRADATAWTTADIPLLDEAAELLGVDEEAARVRAAVERSAEVDYAQGVLDIIEGSRSADFEDDAEEEMLSAADLIDAGQLVDRQDVSDYRSVAERALADREWTYGHVIVDEAQELSAMAWRSLLRRCPTRSMTVVGDVAQTGDPAGASSWAAALDPLIGDAWREVRLTVNYRTPSEIAALADRVLLAIDPAAEPPTSVRDSGTHPWVRQVEPADLVAVLTESVTREVGELRGGRLAVIVAESAIESLRAALNGHTAAELEETVVVLGVGDAKGLEFDAVIIVDPARIVAESDRGLNNLYVALTRPTRRLGIVHQDPLPAGLW